MSLAEWKGAFDAADELYVALVTSSKANARLVSVDASAALAMPGVVGFLDHTCVPGSNVKGQEKEEIFATTEVSLFYWFDNKNVFSELVVS